MSKSDRDQRSWEFRHHHKVCAKWIRADRHWYREGWCVCDTWHDYHWYDWPVPSSWTKDQRRKDRAFTRNKMQRARAGRRDWSAVDERRGDEYYW